MNEMDNNQSKTITSGPTIASNDSAVNNCRLIMNDLRNDKSCDREAVDEFIKELIGSVGEDEKGILGKLELFELDENKQERAIHIYL